MLDQTTRDLVRGTAPVLQQHGEALTSHFYARMLSHNPELREHFNQGHQRKGDQQQALAAAVAAYALHIDNPGVLMPVLERIAARHVSLNIRQEHYAIVGRHLLASLGEVLGDAATPELVQAWAAAYGQLADILIGMEQKLYNQSAAIEGGWTGWRSFRIERREAESAEVSSFYLCPADGGPLPLWRPGQFLTLRVIVPELGYRQPRQYTLSDAPGKGYLRISVTREARPGDVPGMVSNHLHDHFQAGDVLEVSPPQGDFFLHEDRDTPVLLISGGIGITPMLAMLEHLRATAPQRPVRFLHAARSAAVQVFGPRVRELLADMPRSSAWIVHEDGQGSPAGSCEAVGRLDLAALHAQGLLPADADAYVCGPQGFMLTQIQALRALGYAPERIHVEAFGTGGVKE
ncbi:NO-inducible flavohemoprotein [Amphibiibacter pelophylacis]|uniref:NO-inducible flavohemoprotein n=1 Tax=Amphibiibacter pelophylacis TaxID=1799477 RepID=UPI003BFA78CD